MDGDATRDTAIALLGCLAYDHANAPENLEESLATIREHDRLTVQEAVRAELRAQAEGFAFLADQAELSDKPGVAHGYRSASSMLAARVNEDFGAPPAHVATAVQEAEGRMRTACAARIRGVMSNVNASGADFIALANEYDSFGHDTPAPPVADGTTEAGNG